MTFQNLSTSIGSRVMSSSFVPFEKNHTVLVLLQIDVVDKPFKLEQWNFYTKNVKYNTTREKWFKITDLVRLEMNAFYFPHFEIEHPVVLAIIVDQKEKNVQQHSL